MVRETVATVAGVEPSPNETLREYLGRVGEEWSLDRETVEALTAALEREAFGPDRTSPDRVRETLADHGVGTAGTDADAGTAAVEGVIDEAEPGRDRDDVDEPAVSSDASAADASTADAAPGSGPTDGTTDGTPSETEPTDEDGNELDGVFGGERTSADIEASAADLLDGLEPDEDDAAMAATSSSPEDEAAERRTVRLGPDAGTGSLSGHGADAGTGGGGSGSSGGRVGDPGAFLAGRLPGTAADDLDEVASHLRESASPWLLRYLPVLALLPLLGASVPTHFQATREVATHFQALAFARDGLEAYSYLTVREIPWSLHVHSWLASPFVAVGYVEGGRLVSAVAAIAATAIAALLAKRLFGRVAGLLAPVLLWANPYFFRFAWAAMPEMLALFLTTASVAAVVRFDAVDDERWLAVSLACLVVATWTHVWAVAVAAPLAAFLLASHRRYEAGWVGVAAVGSLAVVSLVASLQPAVPDQGFAVTTTGLDADLLSAWLDYWTSRFVSPPAFVAQGLLLVGGVAAAAYWLRRARSEFDAVYADADADGLLEPEPPGPSPSLARAVLLGSWSLAGVSLPLALPAGSVDANSFYLWGAVVPVTLTVAWLGLRGYERLAERDSYRENALGGSETAVADTALRAAVAVLVAAALLNGLVVDAGTVAETPEERLDSRARVAPFDTAPGEAQLAGTAVRERGVTDASEIVFVGGWARGQAAYTGGVGRVLVYSGVLPRGAWELADSPDVRYAESTDAATDCSVAVVRAADGSVAVEAC